MKVITIGRSQENNVVLNSINVSRVHCQIVQFDDGNFAIIDHGSTNGTYVNGIRIRGQVSLGWNDNVQVGDTAFAWQEYFSGADTPRKKTSLPLILGLVGGGIFLLLAVILVIMLVRYNNTKGNWFFPEPTETINDDLQTSSPLYYSTEPLYVNANESLESAFLRNNSNYRYLLRDYGLGGGKLLAEMSADAEGNNGSVPYRDTRVSILSLPRIKLVPIEPNDNNPPEEIVKRIYDRQIWIGSKIICNPSPNRSQGTFVVDIPITPTGDNGGVVVIPEGQMVECVDNHLQNLVVTRTVRVTLNPQYTSVARVYMDCAARKRGDPTGHEVRLTPFKMVAPSDVYANQNSVWKHIESPNTYPITFYVRPRLSKHYNIFHSMQDKGHAFVRIPGIGLTGFGRETKETLISGPGIISNHQDYYNSQFERLDSCTIMVTKQQLDNITKRYRELVKAKKKYFLGHNDCTSFVMDIADAGGILYGNRLMIQYPSTFMDELKAHNNSDY